MSSTATPRIGADQTGPAPSSVPKRTPMRSSVPTDVLGVNPSRIASRYRPPRPSSPVGSGSPPGNPISVESPSSPAASE